jgi:hypothetical protein
LPNIVYTSWRNYDPKIDSGQVFVECPTCEIVEEFETRLAADAFEKAHFASPDHVRKFYFTR